MPPAAGSQQYKYSNGQLVQTYTLQNGYNINAVCTVTSSGGVDTPTCYKNQTLDIVYARPNSNAIILMYNDGGVSSALLDHVRIELGSPDGKYKGIDVYQSGQISVMDLEAP